jgi:hypothetical protein
MNESGIGKLKKLRDEEPARLISRIRLLWPDIKAALGRGHTLKRIHSLLVENGIAIKYQVLSRYVCRLRREDATKVGKSAAGNGKHRSSSTAAAEQIETSHPDLMASDPLANIRERLIRNRPGFNYNGGDPDLSKLV